MSEVARGAGLRAGEPTSILDEQRALLSSLFARGISTSSCDPRHVDTLASAAEELLVVGASPNRKREFRGGRACARDALRTLRQGEHTLLRGRSGEPLWPEGVVGSITHTEVFCAAAVASSDDYSGLGVDVEIDDPVSSEFARRICTPRELARCAELGRVEELARVVFSAKESAYKLQYPTTQTVLYWHDLEILLSEAEFTVRFVTIDAPFEGRMLTGRWARGAGLIATGIALGRAESSSVRHKRPFRA